MCSADYAPCSDDDDGGGDRTALANPSLRARPMFCLPGAKSAKQPAAGAAQFVGDLTEQAMSQGLQYSSRRVQHEDDNPWLHSLLAAAAAHSRGGGGDLLEEMAVHGQERRRLAGNDSAHHDARAAAMSASADTAALAAPSTCQEDVADDSRSCLSMQ